MKTELRSTCKQKTDKSTANQPNRQTYRTNRSTIEQKQNRIKRKKQPSKETLPTKPPSRCTNQPTNQPTNQQPNYFN